MPMVIDLGVIGLLYFAAFAWGSNEPWAMALIAMTSLGLLASHALWHSWHNGLKIHRSALYVPLLLFLACLIAQLVRVPVGLEPAGSWLPHTVERHSTELYALLAASYVAIVFLVHQGFQSRARIKLFVFSILTLGVFESLYGLVQYLGDYNFIWDFDRARLGIAGVASGTLINRNHYALLLNMTISVGTGYLYHRSIVLLGGRKLTLRHVLSSPHSAQLAWILLWLAVMGLALIFSMSRMGIAAMMACVATMIVAAKVSQTGKRAAVLGFALLFVIVGLALYTGIDAVLARYETLMVDGYLDRDRLPIWRDAWKMIKRAPLFGSGLGTFRWTFPAFETFEPDVPARYAHNDYVQALAEVGVVGVVFLVWAFAICWRTAVRNLMQSRDPLILGIGLGTLGVLTACALQEAMDFSLYIPGVASLFAAIVGLNLRASRLWSEVRSPRSELQDLGLRTSDSRGIVTAAMSKQADVKPGLIQKRVLIQASPAIIYHALTEGKELGRWFCDRATSDPRVGGELTAWWNAAAREGRAVFTQIIPNSLVEFRWVDEGAEAPQSPDASHVLSFSILIGHGSSEVLLRDEEYPSPNQESVAIMQEGWNSVLFQLKDYCERKERASRKKAPAAAGG